MGSFFINKNGKYVIARCILVNTKKYRKKIIQYYSEDEHGNNIWLDHTLNAIRFLDESQAKIKCKNMEADSNENVKKYGKGFRYFVAKIGGGY